MSINQTMHGTKSLNVLGVTPVIFDEHLGQWMIMIKDYFSRSRDQTSSPEESFKSIRQRIMCDDKFFMVAYMEHGFPMGFLACDQVGETARILIGYLPAKITGQDREDIIDRALGLFEVWAKARGVTKEIFYTFRSPGAHRSMLKRGFVHDMSIYNKEIKNG